jgi:hypothetical protein
MIGLGLSLLGGLRGGPSVLSFVSGGYLHPSVALTRASPGTGFSTSGSLISYEANLPRFTGETQGLLVEGARTNSAINPTGTGAGVYATGWSSISTISGINRGAVESGTDEYGAFFAMRFSGAASADGSARTGFVDTNTVPAALSQIWTSSVVARIVSGTATGVRFGANLIERNAGNAVRFNYGATVPATTTPVRPFCTVPLAASTVNNVTGELAVSFIGGVSVDFVMRVYHAQMELGPFMSSPILPPPGTLAASSRAVDVPTCLLTAEQAQQGTLVGTFMIPQANTGVAQGLAVLSSGASVSSRMFMENTAGLSTLRLGRVMSGTTTYSPVAGEYVPGIPFKAAISWDIAGTSMAVSGGAPVSLSGGIPVVNQLIIGNTNPSSLGFPLCGQVDRLDFYPTRLSDAQLRSLTAP